MTSFRRSSSTVVVMSRGSISSSTALSIAFAKHVVRWLFAIVLAGLFTACNKSPDRVVVAGNVTYNGKPIEQGQIRFFPDAATSAPMTGAPIIAGRYLADAKGGVPIGSYRVEITGFADPAVSAGRGAAPIAVAAAAAAKKQFLPARFNTQSTLTLSVPSSGNAIAQDYLLTDERGN